VSPHVLGIQDQFFHWGTPNTIISYNIHGIDGHQNNFSWGGPELDCAGLISSVKNKRRVCLTEEFWKKTYCRGPHLTKKIKAGVPPPTNYR